MDFEQINRSDRREKPVLILADGVARIDNRKYKDRFGCKAKMIPADRVEPLVGHDIGGVCPFGVSEGVIVYLDESLRKHEIIYPAVGTDHSGVKLTIPELEVQRFPGMGGCLQAAGRLIFALRPSSAADPTAYA